MGELVSVAWLLLGLTVPLSGTVVDDDGQPVAGATVWLGDTFATRTGHEVLSTAETDAQGRFRLGRADDLKGRGGSWSPTLWVFQPGHRLGFLEFKHQVPGADEPVLLEIGPPASTTVRILTSDGQPASGVRVRPVRLTLKAPRPPDKLVDRLEVSTDADGRAKIEGLALADILWVDVKVKGQVVQTLLVDPETGDVALRPLGRLKVRIVVDDPEAVAGWRITASSRPVEPGYQGPYTTHWARETTGDDGRAEFPPLARGQVLWRIEPPEGSTYLVEKKPSASIRAGETTEVEIPVRQGIPVEGVLREEPGGEPIPGIKVDIARLGAGSRVVEWIVTDDQGRASTVVLPGTVRFSFAFSLRDKPKDFFLPPGIPHWLDFEVKEGEERHEFTPPRLHKAVKVRGRVLDETGEPVPNASVTGSWTSPEFGPDAGMVRAETNGLGEFALGSIAPGSEVRVVARQSVRAESEPVTVARAGEGEPLTLRLREKPTRALTGRVLGAGGQPVAGALVRVRLRKSNDNRNQGAEFRFEGTEEVRTGPDGRYQTPDEIPDDQQARVEAEAEGYEPSESPWLAPPKTEVPDLTLRRSVGIRAVTGRVIDSDGEPVAEVEVFQSGDGPRRTQDSTGDDGRFRVEAVPDAPAFLFARKEGFHFLAQRTAPGESPVELALRRLDEPPETPLRPARPPVPRAEERSIALELAEAARKAPGGLDANAPRSINEIIALADPDRMIGRIENQVVRADADLLTALAAGRSEDDPRKALEILDAVGQPALASSVALGLFDRLGNTVAPEFRRKLLERAGKQAHSAGDPVAEAVRLAQVADRWFDLGDADRGRELVREAQRLAEKPRPNPFPDPRDKLAPVLARIDLPAALKLLEDWDPQQQYRLDSIRAEIAKRLASTDPAGALRVLGQIEDSRQTLARRAVCLRMAAGNLARARKLAVEDSDPIVSALVPAAAAKARAESDPEAARELLREAVDRLGRLDGRSEKARPSPSVMLARLLPMTVRLDPDRAPDVLALALSLRPPHSARAEPSRPSSDLRRYYLDLAELAAWVGIYDRASAEVVFAPVAERLVGLDDEFRGLGAEGPALFRASGAYDARTTLALWDALPEDPPPPPPGVSIASRPRHHSKAQARLALARTLALPSALRLREPLLSAEDWLEALND